MEGAQFFQGFLFGFFAHPFQRADSLTQAELEIVDQFEHAFFGPGREMFFNVDLSQSFSQGSVYCSQSSFPTGPHFFAARKGAAVEVEILQSDVVAKEIGGRIDQVPAQVIFKCIQLCLMNDGYNFGDKFFLGHVEFFDFLIAQAFEI